MNAIWRAALVLTSAIGIAGVCGAAGLEDHDAGFMQKAAVSGKYEIEASRFAHQHSASPQVREFAEMMIADHSKVDGELKALAAEKGVSLSEGLPEGKKQSLGQLQDKAAHELDKAYVEDVAINAHEDAVKLFKKAAEDASDPAVKAFAAKTLPGLQHHLARAKQLQEEMKAVAARNKDAPRAAAERPPPDAGSAGLTSPAMPDKGGSGGGEPTNEPPPASPDKAANPQ